MATLIQKFKIQENASLDELSNFLFFYIVKNPKIKIILLNADLGSGKTTFVQNFAKQLKIRDIINSPTFNIMKLYKIKNSDFPYTELLHIDAYRLEGIEDLLNIAFDEYLDDERKFIMIEWPKNLKRYLNKKNIKYLELKISIHKDASRCFKIYKK